MCFFPIFEVSSSISSWRCEIQRLFNNVRNSKLCVYLFIVNDIYQLFFQRCTERDKSRIPIGEGWTIDQPLVFMDDLKIAKKIGIFTKRD